MADGESVSKSGGLSYASTTTSTEQRVVEPRRACHNCCKSHRRIKSKGAVLVLLWSVAGYVSTALFPAESPLSSLQLFHGYDYLLQVLLLLIPAICSPLAGLVGDAYFGRHKVLRASTFTMWIASLVYAAGLVMQSLFPSATLGVKYSVLLLAHIVYWIGMSAFQVLVIQFGVDQLPDASTEEISAFLHWMIWTWFLGLFIGNAGALVSCPDIGPSTVSVFVCVVVTSFILCTDYLCKSWLIIEPRCQNPMKNIINVLKYGLNHKYPVRRSALTYWEENIPSRIDLGKIKYGGPYTNEQVEDVKTFFRVIVVTVCILAFVIPVKATQNAITQTVYHYKHSSITTSCYNSFGVYTLALAVLYIPIYEFIVYPFVRNFIPSALVKVVVFALVTVAVSLYLMMLEIVGQSQANGDVPCMFMATETSYALPIDYLAVEIPTGALTAVQWLAFDIAAFEFICAQSPYNMKGLLTGFGIVIIVVAGFLGDVVYDVWSGFWTGNESRISCGTWYHIFTFSIGTIGLLLLFAVARWYKRRERDDIVSEQRFAESYYGSINKSHEF